MIFSPRRLALGTGTALVALACLAAIVGSGRAVTVNAKRRADIASRQLDSLVAGRSDSVPAIALGYVERARLGMGSPFRLVDQVVHDHRLPDSARVIVAWAILDRVFDGVTYQVDPAVLSILGPAGAASDHVALIERLIRDADDPRGAEVGIRLAYGLASANGTLGPGTLAVVADVAALIRDRALSERDLRRALQRSTEDGVDLLDEIIHLRTTRELDVERPLLGALSAAQQDAAIDQVPDMMERIAAIPHRSSSAPPAPAPVLNRANAMMLARVGARLPPLSATRVIVRSRAGALRADSTLTRDIVGYLMSATNEESLVAAHAYAHQSSAGRSVAAGRMMIAAAVAVRSLAQEKVWFPGDVGPTAGAIVGRFGLKAIDFDADLPLPWRPYYVRMVASALDDMVRVFPAYDPTNLTVRIGMRALPDSALAMHDPRTHTLHLSAMTSSGTLAHELAHELDWRAARRLFAKAGGYATDRSMRERRLALASSVRSLADARLVGRGRPPSTPSARPAEVFARGVDWLVADVLARQGRSNGYLTAIEDPLIAGFAATPSDAASLGAAASLIDGLSEMTYLPDSVGDAYVQRWQSMDRIDPVSVMLRVFESPASSRRGVRAPFGMSTSLMTDLATGSLCRLENLRRGSSRDRLIALTIESRARGIVLRRARYSAEVGRPAWAHAALGSPPWNRSGADDVLRRTTAAVVEGAARSGLFALPPAPFSLGCTS